MRRTRNLVELAFPAAGTIIVFAAILFLWHDLRLQVVAVLIGLLLIEAGTFKLTRPVLPDDRRYTALREEVDDFIGLVRRLNAAAVSRSDDPAAVAEFDAIRSEMMEAVERISEQAGVEDERPRRRAQPVRR